MSDKERKERWKEGTDELHRAIGEFVVNYEHVCCAVQTCIVFLLEGAGLRDQGIAQILLARLTAGPLQGLFRSLVAQTQVLNEKEQNIVKDALTRFKTLTDARNDIIHSTWFIGWGNEDTTDFSKTTGMKYQRSKSGGTVKVPTREAEDFRVSSGEAECLAQVFQRLNGCFAFNRSVEGNFAVSSDGRVSVPPDTSS